MDTFFKIKKENADGPLKAIAKLFGNSLYGKLGECVKPEKKILLS